MKWFHWNVEQLKPFSPQTLSLMTLCCGHDCADCHWSTHIHSKLLEARTSGADSQERQATNHLWRTTHHPPECRRQDLLPHTCMVVEEINDHMVFIIACVHLRQRYQEHHCGGPALIHTWLSLNHSGRVHRQTLTTVEETCHDTHLHTIQLSNPSLFFPPSTHTKHPLAWGRSTTVPTLLFGDCHVASWFTDRSTHFWL